MCWMWTTCRPSWPTCPLWLPPAGRGLDHLIGQPLDAYEKHAIVETLKLTNGNREEAARILGIGARTLYRKLEKYEIS